MSGPDDGWEVVSDPKEAAAAASAGADKGPVTLSGDAFLSTLDPGTASQVRGMAEGRMTLPNGLSMRSPQAQRLLSLTAQYDPSFDVANAPSRIAARKAFTSGAQGKNITSFNTAIGHLGTLAQRSEDLSNSSFPLWNGLANMAETAVGDPRVTNFNVAKQAVVDELERAFKGTGGNVHEVKQWEETLNSSRSPAQLRGAIGQAADLLNSRIGAMRDSYNAAMNTTAQPLPMLNQHASDALVQFQSPDYLSKGYGSIAAHPGLPQTPPSDPPAGGRPDAPATPPGGSPAPLADTPMAISDGSSVAAPSTPANDAIRADIARLVGNGASADDIRGYMVKAGLNPSEFSGLDDLVAWRKAHPDYKGGYTVDLGQDNVPLTGGASVTAQVAGSAPGAAVIGAADTGTFGLLPKAIAGVDAVTGRLSGDNRDIGTIYDAALQGAHYKIDSSAEAHPLAALVGNTAGFIGADAALGALPGVAKLAGKLPSVIRPAVGDALVGGAYGAGSQDSLADVPGAALKGAGLAAAGGALGRGAVSALGSALSPAVNAGVRRLTDAEITLTPGQILGAGGGWVGRSVKGIEDRLAGFPVIGDVINSTRRGGTEDFVKAATNDALAPIGAKLPDKIEIGHASIEHAQKAVSDAYDAALAPLKVAPDAQFSTDLQAVARKTNGLSAGHREQFDNYLDTHVQPYLAGRSVLDGSDIQAIKQGLDTKISNLRGQGSTPQDRELAENLGDVRDAVLDLAGRSDPANAAEFQKANQAYSMLSRVQDAAAKSKDGVFTPNQFRQAVTKRGYGTTTAKVARGGAAMQQLATDASTILPSTVPDSGTAGRAALGLIAGKLSGSTSGAALGGVTGYEQNGIEGALIGGLAGSALLSRGGARAFQRVVAGSRGKTLNTLGAALRRNAALGGAVGAPALLSRLPQEGN